MRIANMICRLVLAVSLMTFFACSDGYKFQNNNPDPEYRLFSILEDYPALEDAFSGIDQYEFNQRMADALNDKMQETVDILPLTGNIVTPLTGIIAAMRDILGRVVNQSAIDWPDDTYSYENDFYSFFDALSDSNPGLSEDLVTILNKSLGYINDVHRDEVETIMADLITFLKDTDGTSVGSSVTLLQKVLGRLLLQGDQTMWLDDDVDPYADSLITDRANIATQGVYDTGLGDAVAGVDSILSALNGMATGDETGRELLYGVLRELGGAMTSTANGDNFSTVLKDLIRNLEKYYTQGGSVYSSSTDYLSNTNTNYIDAELRNTVKELWPALQLMAMRGQKPDTTVNPYCMQNDAQGKSPLETLTRGLNKLGINFEEYGLEESLYKMVRYDTRYRDRLDPGSGASNISYIDHLLFTLVASGIFGYKDGGNTGESYPNMGDGIDYSPNNDHGHGVATNGVITLNDALYNQGVPKVDVCGIGIADAYSLALASPPGNCVYRYKNSFYATEAITARSGNDPSAGAHWFYLYPSYPANGVMPPECIGDGGIPNGGDRVTGTTYITHWPYNGNGIGELNTARWTMGWIARACWGGEGPYYYADPNAASVDIGGVLYKKYLRANGSIYAYVNKPSENPATWIYIYPADSAADADADGNGERENRYKASWNTDYHMMHLNCTTGFLGMGARHWFYAKPTGSADNPSIDMREVSNSTVPTDFTAGCYTYTEKIQPADFDTRECSSQEEAIYRNFQWVLGEKKFTYIIPMRVSLLTEHAFVWVRIEGNGLAGLANARKYPGYNKRWLINRGTDGSPNTGASYEPGDARIAVDMRIAYSGLGMMGESMVYGDSLGNGYVLPDAIGANMGALAVMGFFGDPIGSPVGSDYFYRPIASAAAGISDGHWADRNKILPIGVAMLGDMRERSKYVKSVSGSDYNWSGTEHKYPLKTVAEGLLMPLTKPMFYYYRVGANAAFTPDSWKPRLSGTNNYLAPRQNRYTYYMPRENRSLISCLSESEYKQVDGLIPLLSQGNMVGKLLALLSRMGDNTAAGGVYANDGGAARYKLFYGLEQVFSSIKTSKGGVVLKQEANGGNYSTLRYPVWMFADNGLRDEDVLLDELLDEFIGSNSSGRGLAVVPDTRPDPGDWENFDKMVAALGELMSVNGSTSGEYCITENVINMMNKLFTSFTATDDQLKGVRHTMGAVCTRYNTGTGTWEYPDELSRILTSYLPDILQAYNGHYEQLLDLAAPLMADGGFVEYLLTSLSSGYTSEEVITQMYAFLTDNTYLTDPDSTFYDQLVELLNAFVSLMDPNADGIAGRVMYDETVNPFYSYMGITPPRNKNESGATGMDPYGALGELLAK